MSPKTKFMFFHSKGNHIGKYLKLLHDEMNQMNLTSG
jgi:hypothetical protein